MIQRLPGPKGQLNAFQRLMYNWSELHPYNATHTFRLVGPARVDALHQAIRETYFLNRLGVVHLDADAVPTITRRTSAAASSRFRWRFGGTLFSMSCVRCCR